MGDDIPLTLKQKREKQIVKSAKNLKHQVDEHLRFLRSATPDPEHHDNASSYAKLDVHLGRFLAEVSRDK